MAKELDWNKIATVNFDDNRRKATGMLTGKELFSKAYADLAKAEAAVAQRKQVEPILRNALLQAILTKSVITVRQAINNPTEAVGGIAKSQDEDDDGFYHSTPSRAAETMMSAKFEEVMETIPVGTELVFKSWDKTLGQWIFKANNGHEYGIYQKDVIIFKDKSMENPGFFGLLYNTNLIDSLEG